ncbi:MAG: phosphatidate cytidylyltransferase [Bacteroidota bacterium]
MSDLLKRSVTGIIFILVMLGGTILHPFVFAVLFAALLFFTQFEFYSLVEKAGLKPAKWAGTISGVLLFLTEFGVATGFLPRQFGFAFIPVIIFLFLNELFSSNDKILRNNSITLLGFVYVAMPFSLINFIVHSSVEGQNKFYPWILVGIFFIIWVYDSVAYLAGSAFGKHKIYEKISPGKSWEGLIAGAVFAVIMGIVNAVLFQALSMVSWIVIALLTVIFGTLGDFFESKIKRETGVKDSGNIMPGHGGFLDRFDSLLFAIPAIFIWLIFSGNI